jgi:hypothetical protein
MRRTLDTRLARVIEAQTPSDLPAARQRSLLRARAAIGGLLHERCATVLELAAEAASALAGVPDTPELRKADAALLVRDHRGVEETFEARLSRLVQQCFDGRQVDPANASPAELLAACLAGIPLG